MQRRYIRFISILVALSFLITPPVYPQGQEFNKVGCENSNLRALSFAESELSNPNNINNPFRDLEAGVLRSDTAGPTRRDLLVFTKPLDVAVGDETVQLPMWKMGQQITSGTVGLADLTRPGVSVHRPAEREQSLAVDTWEEVMRDSLALLHNYKDRPENRDLERTLATWRKKSEDRQVSCAILNGHDHACDLFSTNGMFKVEGGAATMCFDADTLRTIADMREGQKKEQSKKDLALVYAMSMVYFLYRQVGHDELDSYNAMVDFYKALDRDRKVRLQTFLKSTGIDVGETFRKFLSDAINLKGTREKRRTQLERLIQKLRLQVLAGVPPFDLEAAGEVLKDEGDFSEDTNQKLFDTMRLSYNPAMARIHYERLSHIARSLGYHVISQRSSRVSQSQGAILSASEVAVETDKLRQCHRELMHHVEKLRPIVRKMKIGDKQVLDDKEMDRLMSEFDFERIIAEFNLSQEPVPVAVAKRIVALYENAMSKLLKALDERVKELEEETARDRRRDRIYDSSRRDKDISRCRQTIRETIRGTLEDSFFAFRNTIDDAEKFQDVLTILVQRFSQKSAHTIARLLLGYKIYKETAKGMPEVRMRSMSNVTIAPDVDVAIPNSSVYCENAALSIKLIRGVSVVDWANMHNIVRTTAPYVYKAIQNAKRHGWPMFTYKMETTVGHGLIDQVQALLEDEMTNIATIEACGLENEVKERVDSELDKIHRAARQVFKRYALDAEVREIVETRGLLEREAVLEMVDSYSDVARDVAYLLMIQRNGLQDRLQPQLDDESNKRTALAEVIKEHGLDGEVEATRREMAQQDRRFARQKRRDQLHQARQKVLGRQKDRQAFRLEYEQKLHTLACEEVLLQSKEGRKQVGQLGKVGARNELIRSTRKFISEYLTYAELTARKEVIAAHPEIDKSQYMVSDGKDYHFVYNPSRIHFGVTELPSVTADAGIMVGGAPKAVEEAIKFINRMNYSLAGADVFPSADAAAFTKVLENSVRNVLHGVAAAVSMEAKASKVDARQARQVIQERRTTHMLLWTAAMVGGYCLTKEPIFVMLVREMTNKETLDNLGVPSEYHKEIQKIMRRILALRRQYPSNEEWEMEARRILGDSDLTRRYFGDTRLPNWLPDLRLIATVMDKLADPVTDEGRYATEVARYSMQLFDAGLKINDLSAVARVGDIYSGLAEARRLNPFATPDEEARILMQCAYKENVSDVRETANAYMLLLLLGKKDRIKHYGADDRMTAIVDATMEGKKKPASVSFTDPYVDIDGFMDGEVKKLADELKATLRALDLREEQIEECTLQFGTLDKWPVIQRRLTNLRLEAARLQQLQGQRPTKGRTRELSRVESEITQIVMAIEKSEKLTDWLRIYVEGVEPDFLKAAQGKDVVIINSGHENIRRDVNEHLEWLFDGMSIGTPNSSHVFVDSTQQSYGPVLDWFGMLRWLNWSGVYRSADMAPEAIEGYRQEHVVKPRERARKFAEAFFALDKRGMSAEEYDTERLRVQRLLDGCCEEVRGTIDVQLEILRKKFWEAAEIGIGDLSRYRIMAEGLIRLSHGVRLEELDFTTFLVMGGMWMLDKQDTKDIETFETDFKDALADLGVTRTAWAFDRDKIGALVRPPHLFSEEETRLRLAAEMKGTTKEPPLPERTASAGTAERIEKAKEQEAVRHRYSAYTDEYEAREAERTADFESGFDYAMGVVGYSREGEAVSIAPGILNELLTLGSREQEGIFGKFLAASLDASEQLVDEIMPRDSECKRALLEALKKFYNGKTIDSENYIVLCGDHEENPGLLNEMAMEVRDRQPTTTLRGRALQEWKDAELEKIAQCGELLNIALLLGLTMRKGDLNAILNSLSTYFDRILNVHEYDYPPYGYHYLSGGAFGFESDYFRNPEKRQEMMQLCYDRHQWILAYARELLIRRTPLRRQSQDYQDRFLGNWGEKRVSILYEHEGDNNLDIFWNNIRAVRDAVYLMNMDAQEGRDVRLPVIVDGVNPADLGLGYNAVYACSNYTPGVHSTLPGISQGVRIYDGYPLQGQDGRTYRVRVGYTPRPIEEEVRDDRGRQVTLLRASTSYMYLSAQDCERLGMDSKMVRNIGPEGIPCIVNFKRNPVIDGIMNHFTSQDHVNMIFEEAGVPVQWSNVVERMMYMKTVLPEIIETAQRNNPEAAKYFDLIPQMNFLKGDLQRKVRAVQRLRDAAQRREGLKAVKDDIKEQLMRFAAEQRTEREVVKPSEQSGGRGAAIYRVMSPKGNFLATNLNKATDLVYRTCMAGDDVVVQAYVPNSPKVMSGKRFFREIEEEFADFGLRFVKDQAFPPTATFFAGRSYPVQFNKDTRTIAGYNANIGVEEKVNLGMSARLFLGDPELCMEPEFAGLVRNAVQVSSFVLLDAIEDYAPDFIRRYGRKFGLVDRKDLAGISYGRMISGLFDYTPYLLVKRQDNPQDDEWLKVYFEPAPTRRKPNGEVEHRQGLRFFILDEEGKKFELDWSQEEVLQRLRNGTMELKVAYFELNSGIGQVVQHQRALRKVGIDPSELVQHVWGCLGRRCLAYREAVGDRKSSVALGSIRPGPRRARRPTARRRAEEEFKQKQRQWLEDAVEFTQARLAEENEGVTSDDISIVIMKYLESVLMDNLGLEDSAELQAVVTEVSKTLDRSQQLYERCVAILKDAENHRFPLQRRLQEDRRFNVKEHLPTPDAEVVERPGIMSRAGWSEEFINRIVVLALENIRQGWNMPLVRVLDKEGITIEDFERDIAGRKNHVVVCGKLNLVESPLLKLAQDAEAYDSAVHGENRRNVLGVHWRWIEGDPYTNRLMTKRAIVYDRHRKVLKEVNLPRPVEINTAQIFHLPIDNETELHKKISSELEMYGVSIINPYSDASFATDDKYESGRRMETAGVVVPKTELIAKDRLSQEDVEEQIAKDLSRFIRENWRRGERRALIIKPRVATESEGADSFSIELNHYGKIEAQEAGNFAKAVKYTRRLLKERHDVLWQPEEGDARYFDETEPDKGRRRLVLNVQAIWDGTQWTADIGYTQVAENSRQVIVSRGRGASIKNIAASLQKLQYKNRKGEWVSLQITPEHIQTIKSAVINATQALNRDMSEKDMLKLAGVEIELRVIENRTGQVEVVPVVLEANARPAGLGYSMHIVMPEQEGVIETQPLFAALDRAPVRRVKTKAEIYAVPKALPSRPQLQAVRAVISNI